MVLTFPPEAGEVAEGRTAGQGRAEGRESCQGAESSRWRPALGRPGIVRAQGADGVEEKSGLSTGSREAGKGEVRAEMTAGEQPAPWEGLQRGEGVTGAGVGPGCKRARLHSHHVSDHNSH